MAKEILIIDEKHSDFTKFSDALLVEGYGVKVFTQAQEGVSYFLNHPLTIDVLILSSTLEDIHCEQVIQTIRDKAYPPHIILLSDKLSSKEKIAYMKLGASDIFERSYHPLELVFAVKHAQEAKVILENLNREMEYMLEQGMKDQLQAFKAFFQTRTATSQSVLPSEIHSFLHLPISAKPEAILKAIESEALHQLLKKWEKPTVLVVDDELFMQELLHDILNQEFKVIKASSGHEALEIFKVHHATIDLILLDIAMPGETGDKFVSRFLNVNPNVVIVMLTAFKDTDLIVNTIRAGAKDYMTKPFLNYRVLEIVSRAVQNKLIQDHLLTSMNISRQRHTV